MRQGLSRFWANNKGIIVILVTMLCIRSSLADWYHVPTGSMLPTIQVGDRIFVNKAAYRLDVPFTNIGLTPITLPARGDIVVFDSQQADVRLIKRVIGLPGDTVSLRNNQLKINGQPLDYEPGQDQILFEQLDNVPHQIQLTGPSNKFSSFHQVKVPADHLLVLGDNRNHSADSRVYGFVPVNELAGQALSVIVSFDRENYYLPRSDRYLQPLI